MSEQAHDSNPVQLTAIMIVGEPNRNNNSEASAYDGSEPVGAAGGQTDQQACLLPAHQQDVTARVELYLFRSGLAFIDSFNCF